ncbi:class I SAM-dependent methyltransferase [Streptomyces sp. AK02-01A]|uniref:class I SAM-dependent methyltransferase n=1 Tax=Streptomyces sp. AK02-01A TaxID=3028648 RepID=UPI0029AEAC7F|nr:class I SAM-dependent methyltransferase [Streptomyces sp. AK02-01A]MDX3852390.1 class I SAM-dependent methyltransferase [Streptomyces sp. AK02-01A]
MTSEVARLYEAFPFPSPEPDSGLIDVVAREMPLVLSDSSLDGRRVLDAGCGTGHTLVALALRHPEARFTGMDACRRSLGVARHLAERHGATNVDFVHGTMPHLGLTDRFDLIICFGVLHHLPDPRAGLSWLTEHLNTDGLLHLWLYNALGEHGRMLDRELVQLLAPPGGPAAGLETVRKLGLTLPLAEYGFPSGWNGSALSRAEQDVFDADAYVNPVVRPMRFGDMPRLFDGLGMDWLAADRVYFPGGVKFIDLDGIEPDNDLYVRPESLIGDAALRVRLAALGSLDRVRALELRLRPTGFRVLAGRGASLDRCVPRIKGNLLPLPGRTPADMRAGHRDEVR